MKKNLMIILFILIIIVGCIYGTKKKEPTKKRKQDEVVFKDEYIIQYKEEQKQKTITDHTYSLKRNIPKVTNKAKNEVAKKITSELTELNDEEWVSIANEYTKLAENKKKEIKYSDLHNNKNYLSFIKEYKEDGNTYDIKTYVFETKVGTSIRLKSITDKDEELFELVNKETISKIKELKDLKSDWESYIDKYYYNVFTLDDNNLIIYVNKNNVSNEKGILEVKIAKDRIKELLKEK